MTAPKNIIATDKVTEIATISPFFFLLVVDGPENKIKNKCYKNVFVHFDHCFWFLQKSALIYQLKPVDIYEEYRRIKMN